MPLVGKGYLLQQGNSEISSTHPAPPSPPRNYFASIDGLRLLASVNIVLFHLERAGALYHLHGSPGWLFSLLKAPAFHASLFFILGGFIYGVKFAGREQAFNSRSFFRKRLKALYPLHVVTTLLMVLLCVFSDAVINIPRLAFSVFLHLSGTWAFWPQKAYMLNSPAWALSAFFLCYLLLGPTIRITARLATRPSLILAMVCAAVPIFLWSGLYAFIQRPEWYHFFHVFAPIRFCEFVLGILLARMYLLNPVRSAIPSFVNDLIFIGIVTCIYYIAQWEGHSPDGLKFFQYHSLMIPLYAILVYRMVRADGIVAWFFALKPVRSIGMCSFYPYLLHIPLSSLTCFVALRAFGKNGLFHEPLPLIIFMLILYVGSALVWQKFRTGRSKKS
jgi:peptidoglycan/LPS O-acetylase OafA/YrhL